MAQNEISQTNMPCQPIALDYRVIIDSPMGSGGRRFMDDVRGKMAMLRRWSRWLLCVLMIAPVFAFIWYFNLFSTAWYWADMTFHADQRRDGSIWLPSYRVTLDAYQIEGIARNASGLTYSEKTGTLFSAINKPAQIAEIATDGRLRRLIPVDGVDDLEGITHIDGDEFIITDERSQQLYWVTITDETTSIDIAGMPSLGLGIDLNGNLGLEGASWDAVGERLFLAKEKSPMRVFEVDGLAQWRDGSAFNLQIREWQPEKRSTLFMRDISSLSLHESTGHLLVLSDESKLLVEYAADGTPVSMMPLWRGWHGLSRSVPQAEGIALDPDGVIYVMSEPNLLYRFERTDNNAPAMR